MLRGAPAHEFIVGNAFRRIVKVGGFLALDRFNHRSIHRNIPLVEHCFVIGAAGVFGPCSA